MIRWLAALLLIVPSVRLAQAQPKVPAVVNAASFQPGLPRGGALASVFVSGISLKPGTYLAPSSSALPFELAGVQVFVNGAQAPILAVVVPGAEQAGNIQINFQVPLERNVSNGLPQGFPGSIFIRAPQETAMLTPLPQAVWGGFFSDGNGYAIAQHASDYTLVTPQNPAHSGETIIAYADDFFVVWPPPPIALPAPAQPLVVIDTSLGTPTPGYLYLQDYPQPDPVHGNSYTHTPALQTTFEGLAPGLVGVEQINLVVPANQQPGDWALFLNAGSCPDGSGPCSTSGRSSPFVKLPVR